MAIQKSVETSVGPLADYHRIGHIRISWENKLMTAMVVSFWNEQARMANKGAMGSTEFTLHGDDFPFTNEHHIAIRQALDIPDNWKILCLDITYDVPGAYCRVAYERNVMGQKFNSEEQYPLITKESMPVDFMSIIYPMVQQKLFPEAQEV